MGREHNIVGGDMAVRVVDDVSVTGKIMFQLES